MFAGCQTGDGRENEKNNPALSISDTYDAAVDRFTSNHLQDNWVVSRYKDGKEEHLGDSLIWTGIAMASLSCDVGAPLEDRMIKMMVDNNGALVRYEPLGEYANGNEVTFDGATGLYYGIFQRLRRCDTHLKWGTPWMKHLEYLEANNYVLHPNVTAIVAPQFNSIRDYITSMLDQGDQPSDIRYRALEAEALTWSSLNIEDHRPCFPVHLSFLYLSFLEDSGNLLATAHEGFCYATANANLPIIDHWCGRIDIDDWVDDFKYNEWEYRHQRCAAEDWESPDGWENLETPALDLLFGISFVYPEVLD